MFRTDKGRLPQHGRCGDGPLGFGRQVEYGVSSKKIGLAIALAALAPIVILAIWSFAFSRTHAAGAAFLALYFILGFGAYRSVLLRRRAIRTAFFVNGSFLHRWLQGHVGALLGAIFLVGATLSATGYFVLTATWWELFLAAFAVVSFCFVSLESMRLSRTQLKSSCLVSVTSRFSALVVFGVFSLIHMWLVFVYMPTPSWCAEPDLWGSVVASWKDMPRNGTRFDYVFLPFQAANAVTWCLRPASRLEWLHALFVVVRSSIAFLSIGVVMACAQMAAFEIGRILRFFGESPDEQ